MGERSFFQSIREVVRDLGPDITLGDFPRNFIDSDKTIDDLRLEKRKPTELGALLAKVNNLLLEPILREEQKIRLQETRDAINDILQKQKAA